jgi:hypothetical protein
LAIFEIDEMNLGPFRRSRARVFNARSCGGR